MDPGGFHIDFHMISNGSLYFFIEIIMDTIWIPMDCLCSFPYGFWWISHMDYVWILTDSNELPYYFPYTFWQLCHWFLHGVWWISYRLPYKFEWVPYSYWKDYNGFHSSPLNNYHMDSNGLPLYLSLWILMGSLMVPIWFRMDSTWFAHSFHMVLMHFILAICDSLKIQNGFQ